ncbi:MAG: TolC family protein [Bacteroidetes bacterium]|nr:TolC family protein [Bacteroidota bacterium]
MTFKKLLPLSLVLLTTGSLSFAQDKWDLKRCVKYAIDNNISVRQSDIDARMQELNYKQAKAAQFGQANFGTQMGLNFGRSIDPTTNLFTTSQSLYQGLSLQAGANLFNWFSVRHNIETNKYYYEAYEARIDKIKNDVTLNVASAYLNSLLNRETMNLAITKMDLTKKQLENTQRLVAAGSVPELNAAELEAQFATDTAAVISARQAFETQVLFLKVVLNMDPAAPFELDNPAVESIPIEPIAEMQPDLVYSLALKAFPQQKINDLLVSSAQSRVKSVKGQLFPTLSIYGSLGNNFANELRRSVTTQGPNVPTQFYADNAGAQYPVYTPTFSTSFEKQPFGKVFSSYWSQLDNNFRQQIGLQLNVPLFNGLQTRTAYEQAKLNVKTANLNKETDLIALKQNIYNAYYNAVAYMQKFEANKKAVATAERSFDLATKRYNIGLLNSIDYLTNQNNMFTARINRLYAQYNYLFSMKVLEYYKGLGVKL